MTAPVSPIEGQGVGVSADADRAASPSDLSPCGSSQSGIADASRCGLSSNQFECSFFGIINRQGALWTPLIFGSVKDASAYREKVAREWGVAFKDVPRTHKIVPVHFLIEPAQGIETRSAEAAGFGPQDESPVRESGCAQGTPS